MTGFWNPMEVGKQLNQKSILRPTPSEYELNNWSMLQVKNLRMRTCCHSRDLQRKTAAILQ